MPSPADIAIPDPRVASIDDAPRYAPEAPWFIVINAASGAHGEDERIPRIREALAAHGKHAEIFLAKGGGELNRQADRAAQAALAESGLLVAAGGDGTINTVARRAHAHRLPFSVLAQGTFNYFARQHGFPERLEESIAAIAQGRLRPIQVGRVNDHIFLVNASFGLYPQLLADRESFKQQWGRSRPAAWVAGLITLLGKHRLHALNLTAHAGAATEARHCRSSTVFVGNNRLQLEQIGVPEASAVDAGQLVALTLKPVSKLGMIGLLCRGALGALGEAAEVERTVFDELRVEGRGWLGWRGVHIAFDGEQARVRAPLVFACHQQALWLLAPTPAGGEPGEKAG